MSVKVKINRKEWSRQVMASAGMQALMSSLGNAVAAQLPGARVSVTTSKESGGAGRARATVLTDIPMRTEAENGQAQAALARVVGNAKGRR